MENIVSIFTGLEPCEKLHLSAQEFLEFSKENWATSHMWSCEDCLKRWTNTHRYSLATAIQQQLERGE